MLTPNANTATPKCASHMPVSERGHWRMRANTDSCEPPSDFRRSMASVTIEAVIQYAISSPRIAVSDSLPDTDAVASAPSTEASAAQRRRWNNDGSDASFQRASGPSAISSTTGTISGRKTVSKYGGPTEILPMPSASSSSGDSVPRSTEAHTTTNSMLLPSSMDSRDTSAKRAPRPTLGARHAYSASDPPITTIRKHRMKRPRDGSVANACTDDSTPERTMNVPKL